MKTLKVKGKSKTHYIRVKIIKREVCTSNSLCAEFGHRWTFHPIQIGEV